MAGNYVDPGVERVIMRSMNPALEAVLDYRRSLGMLIDDDAPSGDPGGKVVFEMESIAFEVFRGHGSKAGLIACVVIPKTPESALGKLACLFYFSESGLDGIQFLEYGGAVLPPDRWVSGNRRTVKFITILDHGYWIEPLAEIYECPVGGGHGFGPVMSIGTHDHNPLVY